MSSHLVRPAQGPGCTRWLLHPAQGPAKERQTQSARARQTAATDVTVPTLWSADRPAAALSSN